MFVVSSALLLIVMSMRFIKYLAAAAAGELAEGAVGGLVVIPAPLLDGAIVADDLEVKMTPAFDRVDLANLEGRASRNPKRRAARRRAPA